MMGRVLPSEILTLTVFVSEVGSQCEIAAYNWTPKAIGVLT